MTKYEVANKTFVKSSNNSNLIIARYTYTLIVFTICSLLINLIIGNKSLVVAAIKSLAVSLLVSILITYLINIIKKKYNIKDIFIKDNTIAIAIIIGLFGINTNIYILIIAIIVTIIIKKCFNKINLSATLYGILIILLYNNYVANIETPLTILKSLNYDIPLSEIIAAGGGIINYLFGLSYLSPVLSISMFIYLFYKKGIKYQIVIYYILSFFIIILLLSAFKEKIWLVLIELLSGSLLFITTYILTDYKNTPTIGETQIIYGIILGIITAFLRFIIPELAVVISLLLGSIILSKPLDNLNYKFKYNKRLYRMTIIILFIVAIIASIILSFL